MENKSDVFFSNLEGYYIIQTSNHSYNFLRFLKDFEDLFTDVRAAILSFDGDSFKPTEEEYERVWTYSNNEVAYSPVLSRAEVRYNNIIANCYDEWYLFAELPDFTNSYIFVTHSGFRLINVDNEIMLNLTKSFWKRVNTMNPLSFILYGDNFIYGTKQSEEFAIVKEKWF